MAARSPVASKTAVPCNSSDGSVQPISVSWATPDMMAGATGEVGEIGAEAVSVVVVGSS